MKKMNKVFMAALTAALVLPTMATSVSALEGTKNTNVYYDNTNSIPDPGNPDNPEWAVTIPSSVVFTDANPVINVDVSLIAVNGGTLPTTPVTVAVASANGYLLEMSGTATDPVSYVVQYAGTVMNTTSGAVGTLTENAATISGTATLTGTAAQTGSHTDTLTYTITN